MPTISVDQQDLLQLLGRQYTLAELEPLLDLVKGELKAVDAVSGELKIELKDTNRPDLWCPEGIARQLRFSFDTPDYSALFRHPQRPEKQVVVDRSVQTVRPYIGAFIAKGKAITEQGLLQMIQTQEKLCDGYGKQRELIAIGIYNADKITFPVHYTAVEPHSIRFTPLGCEDEMDLADILVRHPKGIEFGGILKGQTRYPLLLDDHGDVLSFPPVINSRTSGEVHIGDNHLFIEVTGLTLEMTLHAVNILACNFSDRGFEIEPVSGVYPYDTPYGRAVITPYPLTNAVEVDSALCNRYLGASFTAEQIVERLQNYGVSVSLQGDETFTASTYPYRQDYMHSVDVIEDLAISTGYNAFEPIMPERFTVGHLSQQTLREDRVRDTMIGFGFEEMILNILTNKEDYCEKVNGMFADLIELSNPMTESYSILRNSLIPSLLKVEAKSVKSLYPHKIFEVGEVVSPDRNENHGCATRSKLAALLAHAEANFSEIGSYVQHLQYLLFWEIHIRAKHFPLCIAGRSGELLSNGAPVGFIGEVHPEILEKWGIKMPAVVFELDLTRLSM